MVAMTVGASLYGRDGTADGDQSAQSGPGIVVTRSSQPSEKERLEIQKLELEVQTLRRWWVPYLPAAFAGIAVVVAFLTAWLTGVFEARNNKLQADNALLQQKSEVYKADVKAFEEEKRRLTREMEALRTQNADLERQNVGLEGKIADAQTTLRTADVAVFMKKLELEGYSETTALDDLVSSLKAQGDDAARQLVQRRAEESANGKLGPLLRYAIYLATLDARWRETLLDEVRAIVAGTDIVESVDVAVDILGDHRWPDVDRAAIGVVLAAASSNQSLTPDFRSRFLRAIGRLHLITKWNYDGARPTTKYRIDLTDFDSFADAVIAARDLALASNLDQTVRGRALWALARFSPPALLATAAQLMSQFDNQAYEIVRAHDGLSRPLQDAVDYANPNASYSMIGPQSPQPHERSLDEYTSTAPAWVRWRAVHADLLICWMETDLATLRANPIKYAAMFDPYH